MILPRIFCSVNSFEPTVKCAPLNEKSLASDPARRSADTVAVAPEVAQPAVSATAASASASRCLRAKVRYTSDSSVIVSGLHAAWAQEVLGDPGEPVQREREHGDQDAAGDEHEV